MLGLALQSYLRRTERDIEPVLDDARFVDRAGDARRLVLCSGKVFYDLLAHARDHDIDDVAIVEGYE